MNFWQRYRWWLVVFVAITIFIYVCAYNAGLQGY
jgi:hypothetical protein